MTICKNAKVNYWAADMDLASMKPMPYIQEEDDDDDDDDEMETSSNGHMNNDDDEQIDEVVERQQAKLERKQKRLDEHLLKNPTRDDMVVFKRMNKYID